MQKRIYIVTHASKSGGANPGLTEGGKDQIERLYLPEDHRIKQVIIGTGKRFQDTFKSLGGMGHLKPMIKYSPLLGSADSGEKTETGFDVILCDGTKVPVGNYVGLIGTPGVNLLEWLNSLESETLLCTGREFLGAIGVKDGQAGKVYIYDGNTVMAKN